MMNELSKKAEKIASASYLITSFFDDKEPLKWRIRSLSTDLIVKSVKDKATVAKELATLLYVSKMAGLVSDANYNILNVELTRVVDEYEKPLNFSFLKESITKNSALPSPKDEESIKDITEEKSDLKEFGAISVKKSGRQSTIVSLLKRKKEIMIKDITPLINGCSEKTIQRELSSMVKSGLLRRMGEKRWSRYSLA